jgi:guanylate kinase
MAKSSPKLTKKIKKPKKSSVTQQITDVVVDRDQSEDQQQSLVSYEEVERYFPKAGQLRPIILIGAAGVGRSELKRRLVASAPDRFHEPVPYTTRAMRPGEVEGEEYFFVSRVDMENDIRNKRFVEYGEYNGNLYGTTFDQLTSIINSGLVCVLCPYPKALRALRCAELKPYVIFVRPVTSLEQLVTSRASASRRFAEDELREMISLSTKMDSVYGHLFDRTIVNDDLATAVNQLCYTAATLETEPHWVPASWITSS